jgi:hypothetical protein
MRCVAICGRGKNVKSATFTILKIFAFYCGVRSLINKLLILRSVIQGGSMSSRALIWAAVPHNSDGVVFQVRMVRGLQRFYMSRRVLEDVFDLEPQASDARQLEHFYKFLERILVRASNRRSIASSDTVALQITDFILSSKKESGSNQHTVAQSAV